MFSYFPQKIRFDISSNFASIDISSKSSPLETQFSGKNKKKNISECLLQNLLLSVSVEVKLCLTVVSLGNLTFILFVKGCVMWNLILKM